MNYELAIQKLMIHGSLVANHEEWSNSFIGLLRPYRKRIDDSVFEEVISCLKAVFPHTNSAATIDSRIATGIQGILHHGRRLLLDENSSLRRSGRISNEEVTRIVEWLNVISEIYTQMLWMKVDEDYLFGDFLKDELIKHSLKIEFSTKTT